MSYINEFAYCCSLQKEWFTLKSLDFVSLVRVSKLLFLTTLQQKKLYKKTSTNIKTKNNNPHPPPKKKIRKYVGNIDTTSHFDVRELLFCIFI